MTPARRQKLKHYAITAACFTPLAVFFWLPDGPAASSR